MNQSEIIAQLINLIVKLWNQKRRERIVIRIDILVYYNSRYLKHEERKEWAELKEKEKKDYKLRGINDSNQYILKYKFEIQSSYYNSRDSSEKNRTEETKGKESY